MKIACLYIATGRYIVFWKDFYLSMEKYFLTEAQKDYFVFTDNKKIDFDDNSHVFKIEQKKLGWPYDTMMRFDLFLSQAEKLKTYDYIFFFNANNLVISSIGEEILPSEKEDGLVVCQHPSTYNKEPESFTYERNPLSATYVPFNSGVYYVQGAFNGGKADSFLKLCKECSKMIHHDLDKNIIPLWHDESALNKYIIDKHPLVLDCSYIYPEGADLPEFKRHIKMITRDKSNPIYGGYDYLRGISDVKSAKRLKRRRKFNFLGIKFSIKV